MGFVECPVHRWVDEYDVGGGACREGASVELEEGGGFGGEEGDEAGEVDRLAFVDEDVVENGELGFEAGDAEGGMVDFDFLLVGRMGGVVAAKDGQRAVGDAFDDGIDVFRRAQGGVHFEIAVEGREGGIRERDVVRADFAGDFDAPGTGLSDEAHTAAGADVLAVDGRIAEFGQHDVAGDNHLLAGAWPAGQAEAKTPLALVHDSVADDRVVLAMVHDGEAEHAGVFHRAAHDFVVLDAMAVVRQRDDSGIEKRADGSEFLAFQSLGDRPGAKNIHAGFARSFFFDPSDRRGAVSRGICIRHGDDGGESTGGCGARAAGHRLFV